MVRAYEEIADFIASGTSPRAVVEFQPSESTRAHVAELIAREKAERLSDQELSEPQHYVEIEHLMRLAKARARALLADE